MLLPLLFYLQPSRPEHQLPVPQQQRALPSRQRQQQQQQQPPQQQRRQQLLVPVQSPRALARQQKEAERRAASLPTVITRLPEHLHASIISNGVLLLDKPKGWTACDCVNAVKSAVKQQKVGHVAPLDCLATGLMVLLLGEWASSSEYSQCWKGGVQWQAMRSSNRTCTCD
jgi:hypothetical protein